MSHLKMLPLDKSDPFIIYSMGKVGSTTVADSLKALKTGKKVYHVHHLARHRAFDMGQRLFYLLFRHGHMLLESDSLLRTIRKGRAREEAGGRRWKVITLVREPISRNISAFFENLKVWCPGYKKMIRQSTLDVDALIKTFFQKYPHKVPLQWLDTELKAVSGIDVYSTDFPRTEGYKVYANDDFAVLLIKLEYLNRCGAKAVREFLGIENFTLVDSNVGAEKVYRETYRRFVDNIVIPPSYIEEMYASKYMRHFYTDEEIEKFREKWKR